MLGLSCQVKFFLAGMAIEELAAFSVGNPGKD